jgi:hypothetical protein
MASSSGVLTSGDGERELLPGFLAASCFSSYSVGKKKKKKTKKKKRSCSRRLSSLCMSPSTSWPWPWLPWW